MIWGIKYDEWNMGVDGHEYDEIWCYEIEDRMLEFIWLVMIDWMMKWCWRGYLVMVWGVIWLWFEVYKNWWLNYKLLMVFSK